MGDDPSGADSPKDSVNSSSQTKGIGLGICAAAVLLGLLHLFGSPEASGRVDQVTLALLAIAMVPWLVPFVTSIKVGEAELAFRDTADLKKKADAIEEGGLLPGVRDSAKRNLEQGALTKEELWALHPNRGSSVARTPGTIASWRRGSSRRPAHEVPRAQSDRACAPSTLPDGRSSAV